MSRVSARIRPASRDDADELAALVRSADSRGGSFGGRPLPTLTHDALVHRMREILDRGRRTMLVAVDDTALDGHGAIVGLLVAMSDEIGAIELAPVLHVTHLLVAPRQRRRGVGRALLAAATHLAEERGLDLVLATVSSSSREANRYLARLGFAPLVVHRVASTATLRRSLGLTSEAGRVAALRRVRAARAQRAGFGPRAVGHGV